MEEKNASFLMTPENFEGLSCVHGFRNCNGQNYQEHIILVMKESLGNRPDWNEMEKEILSSKDAEEALGFLREKKIRYTHEWVD